MTRIAPLPSRGVIAVAGADRVSFLQGLVSNDVAAAAEGRAVWAALLTPQGKWLADFFIFAAGERLLLDVERAQIPMLLARLGRFRLRAAVTLGALDGWAVHAAWDSPPLAALPPGSLSAPDPRLAEAGWRLLLPEAAPDAALPGVAAGAATGGITGGVSGTTPGAATPAAAGTDAAFEAWDRHRLALGLPDGSRDLESEKTVLLEAGFDELGGISWTKGCYMGQELTARTRYRGLVKRRLVPVEIAGAAPAPGTSVLRQDGDQPVEVGTLRSWNGSLGLALLRLDALAAPLAAGEARLVPHIPAWMRLPEPTP
ncbi:MAG: folate-binding protein YgfZ [Proteobacteria bacterium]|nr:folate-binding protein YgfZ [Pseudomonadota bacterium]